MEIGNLPKGVQPEAVVNRLRELSSPGEEFFVACEATRNMTRYVLAISNTRILVLSAKGPEITKWTMTRKDISKFKISTTGSSAVLTIHLVNARVGQSFGLIGENTKLIGGLNDIHQFSNPEAQNSEDQESAALNEERQPLPIEPAPSEKSAALNEERESLRIEPAPSEQQKRIGPISFPDATYLGGLDAKATNDKTFTANGQVVGIGIKNPRNPFVRWETVEAVYFNGTSLVLVLKSSEIVEYKVGSWRSTRANEAMIEKFTRLLNQLDIPQLSVSPLHSSEKSSTLEQDEPEQKAPPITNKVPRTRSIAFEGMSANGEALFYKGRGYELVGVSARVETDGEVVRRYTATRILFTGVFALAIKKKKDNRELFVVIEGQDFAFVVDCEPKKSKQARLFVAELNSQALAKAAQLRSSAAPEHSRTDLPSARDTATQLAELGQLFRDGLLTEVEFSEAKSKILGP